MKIRQMLRSELRSASALAIKAFGLLWDGVGIVGNQLSVALLAVAVLFSVVGLAVFDRILALAAGTGKHG